MLYPFMSFDITLYEEGFLPTHGLPRDVKGLQNYLETNYTTILAFDHISAIQAHLVNPIEHQTRHPPDYFICPKIKK